ncbi:MAG: WYL domain-containing protein [Oscillospiraceae bacterium]
MSKYKDLIKNLDNTRYYMKEFHIYGFKTCNDLKDKSSRTYSNEKRRIESWLNDTNNNTLIIEDNFTSKGKSCFISLNCGSIYSNPLYKAYQYKSFSDKNVLLHFYLLDILNTYGKLSIMDIEDKLSSEYAPDVEFSSQTVRNKLNDYTNLGIIVKEKLNYKDFYSLAKPLDFIQNQEFVNAIKFHSMSSPFGVIGYFILNQLGTKNDVFLIKHNYIVHTLEDTILIDLLKAINEHKSVDILHFGRKKNEIRFIGIPLKILVSTQTGRRYLILYNQKRFKSIRLDYIRSIEILETVQDYDSYYKMLERNLKKCWGTSFGNDRHGYITFNIKIDLPNENYVLNRLIRECRNGIIKQVSNDIFSCTINTFDINETKKWIRSFTGRITYIDSSEKDIVNEFYEEIGKMYRMYDD